MNYFVERTTLAFAYGSLDGGTGWPRDLGSPRTLRGVVLMGLIKYLTFAGAAFSPLNVA